MKYLFLLSLLSISHLSLALDEICEFRLKSEGKISKPFTIHTVASLAFYQKKYKSIKSNKNYYKGAIDTIHKISKSIEAMYIVDLNSWAKGKKLDKESCIYRLNDTRIWNDANSIMFQVEKEMVIEKLKSKKLSSLEKSYYSGSLDAINSIIQKSLTSLK